jgi:hypothetical protein
MLRALLCRLSRPRPRRTLAGSRLTSAQQVSASLCRAVGQFGFTSLGINGLPPPGEGADPAVLTETAPDGFREVYIGERFYLVDHICAQARKTFDQFRYDQAPYAQSNASGHKRFMAALDTYGLGPERWHRGIVRKNRNLIADTADPLGNFGAFRMNHLHPPFNDVRARRVILMAINQKDFMRAPAR